MIAKKSRDGLPLPLEALHAASARKKLIRRCAPQALK